MPEAGFEEKKFCTSGSAPTTTFNALCGRTTGAEGRWFDPGGALAVVLRGSVSVWSGHAEQAAAG